MSMSFFTIGPYIMLEELGSGSFAKVYRCEHTRTHQKYAGKLYDLNFAISETGYRMVRREISILKLLRSPKVIRFQEAVYTQSGVLLVMELVEGRTLLNVMPSNGGLPESFARPIFRQILDALFFLHCNGIVHRDLKLENVMVQQDGDVKLIDFGLADYVPQSARRTGLLIKHRCGSPHYYAPEMITAVNDETFQGDMIDIWASGVLLYSLVTGFHPFYADEDKIEELYEQIVNLEVLYDPQFSEELKNLLRRIFVKDPTNRASLREIQNHPWTNNTILAGSSDSWTHSGDTAGTSSSLRLLEALSLQDQNRQQTKKSPVEDSFAETSTGESGDTNGTIRDQDRQTARPHDEGSFPDPFAGESWDACATRTNGSYPDTTSSTEGVNGEQAVQSSIEEENDIRPQIENPNAKDSNVRDKRIRKTASEDCKNIKCKSGQKRLKDFLKRICGKKEKIESHEEVGTVDSEEKTLTSCYGDENRPPSPLESGRLSRDSLHDFDFEGRRDEKTPLPGPFWKVSFTCWGNM